MSGSHRDDACTVVRRDVISDHDHLLEPRNRRAAERLTVEPEDQHAVARRDRDPRVLAATDDRCVEGDLARREPSDLLSRGARDPEALLVRGARDRDVLALAGHEAELGEATSVRDRLTCDAEA